MIKIPKFIKHKPKLHISKHSSFYYITFSNSYQTILNYSNNYEVKSANVQSILYCIQNNSIKSDDYFYYYEEII